MPTLCTYCGNRNATTADHVPPKSFFATPRPNNLITVPCCKICNGSFGKGDERVRNLLTSLQNTENHPAIQGQIADKRNRSYLRPEGASNFLHILNSLKPVDVYTPGGIALGSHPAFNLDQELMNRFIERVTRALLHHETSVGYADGNVEWRMAPTLKNLVSIAAKTKAIRASVAWKEIGKGVFGYAAYCRKGSTTSLYIMSFYGGAHFMSIFREHASRSKNS
jgi:hypothetical protein